MSFLTRGHLQSVTGDIRILFWNTALSLVAASKSVTGMYVIFSNNCERL